MTVVAATDQHANRYLRNNYGSVSVDLAAPGMNILFPFVALSDDAQEYKSGVDCGEGTSVAAPMVTGAFGLLFAHRPGMYWRGARNAILYSAENTANQQTNAWLEANTVTGKRLNAGNALAWPDRPDVTTPALNE